MTELEIHLENCYGIRRFKHKFNFGESKTQLIYAPNGVMKSSLASTFDDIAEGKLSKDRIFSNRVNHREVKIDGIDIEKDEIFVIQRMKSTDFKEASTILANEKLKNEYDALNSKLIESKNDFFKQIQPLLGIKSNAVETEIESVFRQELFKMFETYDAEINEIKEPIYSDILYSEVFNDKTIKFLESKDFKSKIKDYIKVYDTLVNENDALFMKGTFNHYNADTVTKSLKDNNFFSANHKVKIKDQEITNAKELEDLIFNEKEKVLKDPLLANTFNEIDKLLNSNAELRKFRNYVEENQEIIKEFADLSNFKKKLILNYLAKFKNEFNILLKLHKDSSIQRDKIILEAKKEQDDWKNVIDIFKRRFTVPFEVHIKNQESVILNSEPASLLFKYTDGSGPDDTKFLGGTELQESLSTGEQRVFYLLNIIFQIETRRKLNKNQLVIVDDIADSFDYKNKYAIIEYLKDVLDDPYFFMIILTHNFDFYKTIKSRLGAKINYQGNWTTTRKSGQIELSIGEKRDVFPVLRSNHDICDFTFIACVPFVRNLIDFTIGDDNNNYLLLTSLLHMKPERADKGINKTEEITVQSVLDVFNTTFQQTKIKANSNDNVFDLIITKAEEIYNLADGNPIDIKYKICISIGIRLLAEKFMISKIVDPNFHNHILKKQTGQIVDKYRAEFPVEKDNLGILDRVNLMTPENIHVNSFMYEPLMDLTDDHLKILYNDVKTLA
ncbi:hypothetical protein H8R23_12275 [Flavobacterium sp. F-380]|uniref:Protein CR006 P-loop domain-containing protein n=1 Tax=Flavobacterium kayseriense TaxID=2764714 RepID=A0ABR7J9L0_9FLAO|nr:hypothetical protein [Flavobacterium kayseriense]MBC5842185.1 hypothetical protein [Flavobacterium kayseriense]MBC5848715.1 hypothetical protein [Flavobacterium kayseriense]